MLSSRQTSPLCSQSVCLDSSPKAFRQHSARLSTSSRRLSQSASVIIKYFMILRISFLVGILGSTVFVGKLKLHVKRCQRNREQEGCKWNSRDTTGAARGGFRLFGKQPQVKADSDLLIVPLLLSFHGCFVLSEERITSL